MTPSLLLLLPAGPDDLPELWPRVLLPDVLRGPAHLPPLPHRHRAAHPHLPQQLAREQLLSTWGCRLAAQGSSEVWVGVKSTYAHAAVYQPPLPL